MRLFSCDTGDKDLPLLVMNTLFDFDDALFDKLADLQVGEQLVTGDGVIVTRTA